MASNACVDEIRDILNKIKLNGFTSQKDKPQL